MRTERPTCRECACNKVCEYCIEENGRNLGERCVLGHWEKFFVPKQEWISVDERLPETRETILYFNGKWVDACYFDGDSFMTLDTYESDIIYEVTHWMPLPEAPKKGGAE